MQGSTTAAKLQARRKPAAKKKQTSPGIIDHPKAYLKRHPHAVITKNLGEPAYRSGRTRGRGRIERGDNGA